MFAAYNGGRDRQGGGVGRAMTARTQEWIWGWDATPGIVSVWAQPEGRVHIWRRLAPEGAVIHEMAAFRPWVVLPALDDLAHLGARLQPHDLQPQAPFTYRQLDGPSALRYVVAGRQARTLEQALITGASQRLGRTIRRLAELAPDDCLWLPLDEQYLVASGRTYYKGIGYQTPLRLQCDLETTGLNGRQDRVFLIAIRSNRGHDLVLESNERELGPAAGEADLLQRLMRTLQVIDPDVIENHNLLGFDLPFLAERAQVHGLHLALGRLAQIALDVPPRRATDEDDATHDSPIRYARHWFPRLPGREVFDTLTAVRRHDFVTRDMPGHGLKEAARYFGIAPPDRTYVAGAAVFATWQTDPERVRAYARDDVSEAADLASLLGGAPFALAQMVPRRATRLAEAGMATGILDPLIARAYLRAGAALPGYAAGDGTMHTGAALYLFATGVAHHVVKADVASLYPSLMRHYRIGPQGDYLQVLLTLVDALVEQRLAAKTLGRASLPGSAERTTAEALSAAFKVLVNSAYGYCGAVGLTRCADVHAANEITRHGRELLTYLCQAFAAQGATLLEADTDGVFLAVPEDWDETRERQMVAAVGATLPELIRLEFEGRYAAMFSYEPKNYALLTYDDRVLMRGVALRSIRFEPFGQDFLRQAMVALLHDRIPELHALYRATHQAIRARAWPTERFAIRARLKKSPAQYLASRPKHREGAYEAQLRDGHPTWQAGDLIHFYRATDGYRLLHPDADARDYDVPFYLRLLRETYAARLERAFSPEDCANLFGPDGQPSLFSAPLEAIHPRLLAQSVIEQVMR